jgi:hypothetical protein
VIVGMWPEHARHTVHEALYDGAAPDDGIHFNSGGCASAVLSSEDRRQGHLFAEKQKPRTFTL